MTVPLFELFQPGRCLCLLADGNVLWAFVTHGRVENASEIGLSRISSIARNKHRSHTHYITRRHRQPPTNFAGRRGFGNSDSRATSDRHAQSGGARILPSTNRSPNRLQCGHAPLEFFSDSVATTYPIWSYVSGKVF